MNPMPSGDVYLSRVSPSKLRKFYTDSEERVWEGCDKMSKGLEGPKSHDIPLVDRPAALQDAHHSLDHHCVRQRRRQRLHDETVA